MDAEGHWTQKVIVQCKDEKELRKLHRAVHGKRVTVGRQEAMTAVESLYMDLRATGGVPSAAAAATGFPE